MPKEFYTERDIEDLFKRGVMSLDVSDDVVLTELAYEKANRLGMKLNRRGADTPPAAPVRPYLSQKATPPPAGAPLGGATAVGLDTTPSTSARPAAVEKGEGDLQAHIRSAVLAKLGNQVDPALLDVIIQRVLKSTGVK